VQQLLREAPRPPSLESQLEAQPELREQSQALRARSLSLSLSLSLRLRLSPSPNPSPSPSPNQALRATLPFLETPLRLWLARLPPDERPITAAADGATATALLLRLAGCGTEGLLTLGLTF